MKLKEPPLAKPTRWHPSMLGLQALSVQQPWAWLIVNGFKDIENRTWRRHFKGRILIHSPLSTERMTAENFREGEKIGGYRIPRELPLGGIVGIAELVECVLEHQSKWKEPGTWGWVLKDAKPLPFRPCKGGRQLFHPEW